MTDLGKSLGQFLEQCLESGFELPIIITFIGVNGSVVTVRFMSGSGENPGVDTEMLAEHYEGPGIGLPINGMAVDVNGEAAHWLLDRANKSRFFRNPSATSDRSNH